MVSGSYEGLILAAATSREKYMPSSLSRRGIAAWKQGAVLRLSGAHKEDWCTDCWITIMLDVTSPGLYSLTLKTDKGY